MSFMDKLYGVAEKVGDTVEKGAKTVTDGSKKVTEKMKLKKEISNTESEMNNAYIRIGKKYFELHSASPSEEYIDEVNSIKAGINKIEQLKSELALLEDKYPCPNCGVLFTKGSKFCAKCGANVETAMPVKNTVQSEIPAVKDSPETDTQTKCGESDTKIEE